MRVLRNLVLSGALCVALAGPGMSGETPEVRLLEGDGFPVWVSLEHLFQLDDPISTEIQSALVDQSLALERAGSDCFETPGLDAEVAAFAAGTLESRAAAALEAVDATVTGRQAGVNGGQPSTILTLQVWDTWRGEEHHQTLVYQFPAVDTVLPTGQRLCTRVGNRRLPAVGDEVVLLRSAGSTREGDWIFGSPLDQLVVVKAAGGEGLQSAASAVKAEGAGGSDLRTWLRAQVEGGAP